MGAIHDDVIKWKHLPRNWPFVRGIHRSPVNSPHKGQWRGALMFYLICALMNGWVNIREAGDLRRHHAHYDVIVMSMDVGQGHEWTAFFIRTKKHLISPVILLLVLKLVQINNKGSIEAPHYWPFVWGIHQLPVDFSHKKPNHAESVFMTIFATNQQQKYPP